MPLPVAVAGKDQQSVHGLHSYTRNHWLSFACAGALRPSIEQNLAGAYYCSPKTKAAPEGAPLILRPGAPITTTVEVRATDDPSRSPVCRPNEEIEMSGAVVSTQPPAGLKYAAAIPCPTVAPTVISGSPASTTSPSTATEAPRFEELWLSMPNSAVWFMSCQPEDGSTKT